MQVTRKQYLLTATVVLGIVCGIVFLGIRQYQYNVSTLLHMDVRFGVEYNVPPGVVLYEDGGYDGMAYYEIAREIPALFLGGETQFGSAYRFQRILFPLFGFIFSLGNTHWLPWALLVTNLFAALGTLILMMHLTGRPSVHTLAVVLNPAMLVGILFSLTEPLSLFFAVAFLFVWEKQGRKVGPLAALMLLLSMLARETTIFLIALLMLFSLLKKDWKGLFWLGVSIGLFLLWQTFLREHFGSVAFQANSNIINFTMKGPRTLIVWLTERVTMYRLSSVPLLLFVALLSGKLLLEWRRLARIRTLEATTLLLTGLVGTILSMDSHMWGVITSIGRVVTPIYPVYALFAETHNTRFMRFLSLFLIVFSIVSAMGVASVVHPYRLS